jgi:uncharacterized protein YndB with AHSA1/START domain
MVPDSVEREVQINAPIEVVWSIVTEPKHIGSWFSDAAEVDLRPGGDLLLTWESLGSTVAIVERVEPPHAFAFRWVSPEPERDPAAREGHFTLVEFLLRAEGDGTLLRVVESGFAELEGTAEANAELAARHTGGWGTFLDKIAARAVATDVSA